MSFLLEFLSAISIPLPELGPSESDDLRLLKQQRIRSLVRAVEGRTHNIGTEWSSGTCEVSEASLVFHPTIGIVGDRTIPVVSLSYATPQPELQSAGISTGFIVLIVATDQGDLYWALPERVLTAILRGVHR